MDSSVKLQYIGCTCDKVWLGTLLDTKSIYLNYSRLTYLPSGNLCKKHIQLAQNIYARNNLISTLQDDLYLHFTALCQLYLPSNRLTLLPSSIGMLSSLKSLNVTGNQIKTIPSSISKLKALQFLGLSNNLLEEIPCEIGKMDNLEILDISHNQLRHFNVVFSKSSKLTNLWMSYNRIKFLPHQFSWLKNLTELCISSNNICFLPIDLGRSDSFVNLQMNDNKLLYAIPDHLRTKLSFYNSGFHLPLNDELASHLGLQLVSLPSSSNNSLNILQPMDVCADGTTKIPSLQQFCLAVLHQLIIKGHLESQLDLPDALRDRLTDPDGHCFRCSKPLYLHKYIKYVETVDVGTSQIHTVAYYCSQECFKE